METEAATGIMATVDKGDLPAKTGAAREFLVNSLKVGDELSINYIIRRYVSRRYEIYF